MTRSTAIPLIAYSLTVLPAQRFSHYTPKSSPPPLQQATLACSQMGNILNSYFGSLPVKFILALYVECMFQLFMSCLRSGLISCTQVTNRTVIFLK